MNYYSNEELENEVSAIETKPTAYSGVKYPIEYLSPREFELLVYFIFQNDKNSENYEFVRLLKGVSDRGRDIILINRGKNVGVVQCKRYISSITKPELAREVIKFCIHSLMDESFIYDEDKFSYYFVALSGFNEKAQRLVDDFNIEIFLDKNYTNWVDEVLEQNEAFKDLQQKVIDKELRNILSKIILFPLTGVDLNLKLKNAKQVVATFFEVEKVVSEEMLDKKFSLYFDFKNDTDLERIRDRLRNIPEEKRAFLGYCNLFGYDEGFVKILVKHQKELVEKITEVNSFILSKLSEYLYNEINKLVLVRITSVSNRFSLVNLAILQNLFAKYSSKIYVAILGNKVFEISNRINPNSIYRFADINVLKEKIIEENVNLVIKNWTKYPSEEPPLKEVLVEKYNALFDEEYNRLSPIVESIELELEKIVPENSTIIIEHFDMFSQKFNMDRLFKESSRFTDS